MSPRHDDRHTDEERESEVSEASTHEEVKKTWERTIESLVTLRALEVEVSLAIRKRSA